MNLVMQVEADSSGRARTCDETVSLVRPFFDEAGITRVADVTGLDVPRLPVFVAVRPNARSLSISQGKGVSKAGARASAVMEALEHFHAEHTELALRLTTRRALGTNVADVDRLPHVNSYPLHPDQRLLWTQASELGTQRPVWVPFDLVHLDMVTPLPTSAGCFPICSNGLASGNDLTEATVHGLYELVERDAWMLFHEASDRDTARRRIDLTSISDPQVLTLLEQVEQGGLYVALWDATSDIGVCCVLAAVLDRNPNPHRPAGLSYGCGCHAERERALLRALTEAAQGRVTNVVGTRDDTRATSLETIRSEAYLERQRAAILAEPPVRAFSEVQERAFAGYAAEVEWLTEHLHERGFPEVLRVDLSREGWPISVVRMIVPGLEGYYLVPDLLLGPRAVAVKAGSLEGW